MSVLPSPHPEISVSFLDTLPRELEIDNGVDKAILYPRDVYHGFKRLVGEDAARKMIGGVLAFNAEVKTAKSEEGMALGSSDLQEAIKSHFYGKQPEEFGFKTDTELNLAAALMKTYVKSL